MATIDVGIELQAYVNKLAADADDEFEFFAMIHQSMVLLDQSRLAQIKQNADLQANMILARRASQMGKTVDELKQEVADQRVVHVSTVSASDVLDLPVKRAVAVVEVAPE